MNAYARFVTSRAAFALAIAPALVIPAFGQAVVSRPSSSASAPASGSATPAASKSRNFANVASALRDGLPLLRRGPVVVHAQLLFRFIQAEGLHARPGFAVDTSIQELSPSLLFDIGDYWHLTYTPTSTFYSSRFFTDAFNQYAHLSGGRGYGRLHLNAAHTYANTNSVLIETGGQTDQNTHTTSGGASYNLGRRTMLQTEISRSDRQVGAPDEDPQWTASDWLQYSSSSWLIYKYSSKLSAGVGFEVGYANISAGPNMAHTRPQVQLTWRPSEKLSLHAQGGVEQRSIEDDNDTSLNNPIYSGTLEHQLFSTTSLSLSVSRSVSASHFANRASRTSGWTVGIEQRLLGRFYFTGEFAERRNRYLSAGLGELPGEIPPERDDTGHSFNARLSTRFLQRGSISLSYQTSRNDSDTFGYGFRSSQYGFELDYRF